MRLLQTLLLSAALALGAAACDSPPADVERTEEALDVIVDDIEAIDGVQAVDRLGPDQSTGFTSATVLVARLTVEPGVDRAAAERIVEQAAELIWHSDVPTIDTISVNASGQGLEGHLSLYEVLDDTNSDGLRAHFGERR